jgi:hypothetical protein
MACGRDENLMTWRNVLLQLINIEKTESIFLD